MCLWRYVLLTINHLGSITISKLTLARSNLHMYYVFTLTSLFWSPQFALLCSLLKSFDVSKQKQLENDRNLSNLGPTKTSTSGRFVSVKPTKTTTGNRVRSSSAASEDGTVRCVWSPIVLEMDTDFCFKKKKLLQCVIVSCRCANFFLTEYESVWHVD